MKISGKNIILTGASSGIGLEILKLLSQYENVRIIAAARDIDDMTECEGVIYPFPADLSKKEGIDELFDYAQTVLGQIDIFIANAGIAYMEKLDHPDWDHIQDIFALNVFSAIYSLEKIAEIRNDRNIFFACTSSAVAIVPLSYYALYTSTKSALRLFFDTYRYEKHPGVHTMVTYPIASHTTFFKKASSKENPPLPFLRQDPQTVAKAIVRGIELNKKKVYPSFLFRLFHMFGSVFPFVFRIYSWNEKRKVEKYLGL